MLVGCNYLFLICNANQDLFSLVQQCTERLPSLNVSLNSVSVGGIGLRMIILRNGEPFLSATIFQGRSHLTNLPAKLEVA